MNSWNAILLYHHSDYEQVQ